VPTIQEGAGGSGVCAGSPFLLWLLRNGQSRLTAIQDKVAALSRPRSTRSAPRWQPIARESSRRSAPLKWRRERPRPQASPHRRQ